MPKRDGWVAALSPRHWAELPFDMEVVNVHISAPHLWPYFPHPIRRQAQLAALLADRRQSADIPHAILGDFNSSPAWPVYKKMAARYVDGALQGGNGELGNRGSWPSLPWMGVGGLLRIDHCFLWKLTAERARFVPIRGSDHLGLIVDIAIGESLAAGGNAAAA
jgi:endonuclease/exonuclease/phosphatase family metal-dependent hydrolase